VKKFLMVGALAVGVALLAQQRASAWQKWSVFVGLGISYEGGNNSSFWGGFRSGQVPGYPTDVGSHGYFNAGAAPGFDYGYGGYGGNGAYYAPAPQNGAAVQPQFQAPQPKPVPEEKKEQKTSWYGNPNYQPAVYYYQAPAYTAPAQNYYQQQPYYYYPGYGYYPSHGSSYGGQQVPSYWYGY
jgi:hypothetical protein